LGARLGGVWRDGLANQAKAYKEYGTLLQRWSAKEVKATEFVRDSVDIYVGTAGKVAASAVAFAGELLGAGVKSAGRVGTSTAAVLADEATPVIKDAAKPAKGSAVKA
jgi:hypothetical protein